MMPLQPIYIAVCPVSMAENWETFAPDLPNPVSVYHTIIKCSTCGKEAWIGPKQKQASTSPDATIICYACIATDPEFLNADEVPVISLDPNVDNDPRRY